MPNFSGVVFNLNGIDYTVPPLNLRSIKELKDSFEVISKTQATDVLSAEYIDAVLNIIFKAITRNYPDMTKEKLQEFVDLGNMRQLCLAARGFSGLINKDSQDVGEAVTQPAKS